MALHYECSSYKEEQDKWVDDCESAYNPDSSKGAICKCSVEEDDSGSAGGSFAVIMVIYVSVLISRTENYSTYDPN